MGGLEGLLSTFPASPMLNSVPVRRNRTLGHLEQRVQSFIKDTALSLPSEKEERTLSRGCQWWKQQSAKKWREEGEEDFSLKIK